MFYYLDSFRQPYSEAYVEAMLLQYFLDIVAETRKFADGDRVLYEFDANTISTVTSVSIAIIRNSRSMAIKSPSILESVSRINPTSQLISS